MIKIGKIFVALLGIGLSYHAFATWQMVSSSTTEDHGPFFQAGLNNNLPGQGSANDAFSDTFSSSDASYEINVYPGTLKSNLDRIMKNSAYKLLWNSKYDYRVVSQATIRGKNFDDALNRFLVNYPVKAVFYEQNDIMTIVPKDAQ